MAMLTDLQWRHETFKLWMNELGEDNGEAREKAKKLLKVLIENELTDRQREYILLYFTGRYTMDEIGQMCGANGPSVSRCISRGLNRIYKVLRYVDPCFYEAERRRTVGRNFRREGEDE